MAVCPSIRDLLFCGSQGTIFESRRKTAPFHGYNDVGSRHPFATKRPILAGLNCGINDGSSFCGAQAPEANPTQIRRLLSFVPDSLVA